MVEYNNYHNDKLIELFGEHINLSNSDYLLYQSDIKFDIIIGNPPYNQNHLRHIPNKINPKKTDKKWVPIWHMFIEKSIELLNDYGYLLFIIPTTWLKPDKANIYHLLTKYKIHKLHSLSSYEVYKAFNKLNKDKIKVISFSSLTTDLCKKYKSNIILRGLRAVSDFEYEFQLAGMNKKLKNDIETIFLMSDVENQIISSKFVKEIAKLDGQINKFLTNPKNQVVVNDVERVLGRKARTFKEYAIAASGHPALGERCNLASCLMRNRWRSERPVMAISTQLIRAGAQFNKSSNFADAQPNSRC